MMISIANSTCFPVFFPEAVKVLLEIERNGFQTFHPQGIFSQT
jgi:hypothetical protein